MTDFNVSVTNSTNKNVTRAIACDNSNLSASNSATITCEYDVNCTGDVVLTASHSGTINIAAIFHLPKLTCKTLTVEVDHASTVTIYNLACDNLILDVSYASTVTIGQGTVGTVSGTIKHASICVCHAKITGTDNVQKDSDSTWTT
jgi:hypothetical protein